MRKLDQIRRSDSEDICVLLRDVRGALHLELRVYRRPEGSEEARPGPEAISVPVKLSVGCRLMNAGGPHPGSAVFGEVKDLSIGGAQVCLPERFSLFSKMEVLTRIGGLNFQGRAEFVGAEVHPTREGYCHSMRWLGLSNHAKATLSQAIARS